MDNRIRDLREDHDLSQRQLAEAIEEQYMEGE